MPTHEQPSDDHQFAKSKVPIESAGEKRDRLEQEEIFSRIPEERRQEIRDEFDRLGFIELTAETQAVLSPKLRRARNQNFCYGHPNQHREE